MLGSVITFLREIYRKFGRISSIKRIFSYKKNRVDPARKTLLNFLEYTTASVGPQTAQFALTEPSHIPISQHLPKIQ